MLTCCIQMVGTCIDTFVCVCVLPALFLFSDNTAAPGDPLIHGMVKLVYCTRGFIWRVFCLSLHYSAPDPVELETAK